MGNSISFGNTPQANDDYFNAAATRLTEDNLATDVVLDVMANDLGGNAKSLFSLDAGTEATTALKQAALLTQDASRTEALSTDYSANGARIWIGSDGKVHYDASTLSGSFKAQLQQLSSGETLTDT